uniref:beta-1,4-galactosyltransferase 4-like n=1 Tax=Styela clava TaxID=7725 RepID=UPI001939DB73|nr:beta-1,4-galactosyltransferase 4-like [Styela clava]
MIISFLKRWTRVVFALTGIIWGGQLYRQYGNNLISTITNLKPLNDFASLETYQNELGGKNFTRKDQPKYTINLNIPECDKYPFHLNGEVTFSETSNLSSWTEIAANNSKILEGGRFFPSYCKPKYRVAIIVPFRNRESQLKVLLSHMHPIWQRQEIDYTVYTLTQAGDGLFNRAKLMNTGVAEAKKDGDFDCYVFHDVDILAENDKCLYSCHEENPRHVAAYLDAFDYQILTYGLACTPLAFHSSPSQCFGGVTMLSKSQFEKVNGFSNIYWGWGGEDDDMYLRIRNKGYSSANPYGDECSFRMIKHDHESSNAFNPSRHSLLFHAPSRMDLEGYSSLRYNLLSIKREALYTNITVSLGQPSLKMMKFMEKEFDNGIMCQHRMPWNL